MDIEFGHRFIQKIKNIPPASIITIEGFSGSGKTTIADHLSRILNIHHIDTDCFIENRTGKEPYINLLDLEHISEIIQSFLTRNKSILFSGICVRDVLQKIDFQTSFSIYVKQISSNGLWHGGLNIEDSINDMDSLSNIDREPHKSDMEYHIHVKPHEKADQIYKYVRD